MRSTYTNLATTVIEKICELTKIMFAKEIDLGDTLFYVNVFEIDVPNAYALSHPSINQKGS